MKIEGSVRIKTHLHLSTKLGSCSHRQLVRDRLAPHGRSGAATCPAVLGEDYCSGYIDTFGKWSNGFPCPSRKNGEACTKRDMQNITRDIPQLPLILGVVFGVAVAVIVIVVVSCFHCSCCLLYKKRQPTNGGEKFIFFLVDLDKSYSHNYRRIMMINFPEL
ncbi:protein shisa-4-like [Penaeus japonicus]|uniref:protein shisa-4-like n=1 Tax=Penaeus japonicus TaxID=27405 RepID=UPI001C70FEEF|nr:protein shisa-4-like [Penaeus japonicus]